MSHMTTTMPSSSLRPDIPIDFLCPISSDIMERPVQNEAGQTYDYESIVRWYGMGHSSDPLTRKEIKDTTHLVPNKNLRKAIKDWRQRHALQIFVKTEHKTITLWVDVCDTTISTIRRKIKDKGIAVGWNFEDSDVNGGNSSNPKKRSKHLRSLWYASKYLEDNRTLGYYGIEPESTLWLGG